jgi:hypothetical protein
MDIYYLNSNGQKVDLVSYPYMMLTNTDLFDYDWDNSTSGTNLPRISSFSRSMVSKKIKINVKGQTYDEYLQNIENLTSYFDFDVMRVKPGRLYVGNYYLECYIKGSTKPNKYLLTNNTTVEFSLMSSSGMWKTSNILHFGKSTNEAGFKDADSNIALNSTVTSSPTSENLNNLADGDFNTEWRSPISEDTITLKLNLGQLYYLDNIKLYWGDVYATEIDVLGSVDGVKSTKLAQLKNLTGAIDDIELYGINQYQYIFLTLRGRLTQADGYTLKEIEIYGSENFPYLDFPYDYKYDYTNDLRVNNLYNDGYAASDFILTIYGRCEDPLISIGDWNYGATNVTIETREKLIIDSAQKKVYKISSTGEIENLFSHRLKDFYAFQKIEPGTSIVGWNGPFEFDIELSEDRSEPKWT